MQMGSKHITGRNDPPYKDYLNLERLYAMIVLAGGKGTPEGIEKTLKYRHDPKTAGLLEEGRYNLWEVQKLVKDLNMTKEEVMMVFFDGIESQDYWASYPGYNRTALSAALCKRGMLTGHVKALKALLGLQTEAVHRRIEEGRWTLAEMQRVAEHFKLTQEEVIDIWFSGLCYDDPHQKELSPIVRNTHMSRGKRMYNGRAVYEKPVYTEEDKS